MLYLPPTKTVTRVNAMRPATWLRGNKWVMRPSSLAAHRTVTGTHSISLWQQQPEGIKTQAWCPLPGRSVIFAPRQPHDLTDTQAPSGHQTCDESHAQDPRPPSPHAMQGSCYAVVGARWAGWQAGLVCSCPCSSTHLPERATERSSGFRTKWIYPVRCRIRIITRQYAHLVLVVGSRGSGRSSPRDSASSHPSTDAGSPTPI